MQRFAAARTSKPAATDLPGRRFHSTISQRQTSTHDRRRARFGLARSSPAPTMDDALARLDAELASVDPAALASADGAILAAACARVATAALDSARRSEDALQWARAALHYDATNEEARWCEAKSLDALNRRLALAIKRYEELAALDTSPFGALARQRLDTSTVR